MKNNKFFVGITLLLFLFTVLFAYRSLELNNHLEQSNDIDSVIWSKFINLNNSDNIQYDGKWISTNYQIVMMDGYTVGFGSELYLKYKSDGVFEINMYDISSPPASRIASLETEVKISSEGKGEFTFSNDGWGSHGRGLIELQDGRVIINIDSQIEVGNNPIWRIFSGERVFIREDIL